MRKEKNTEVVGVLLARRAADWYMPMKTDEEVSVGGLFEAAPVLWALPPPNAKLSPWERYHRVEHT